MELSDITIQRIMEYRRAHKKWLALIDAHPFDVKAMEVGDKEFDEAKKVLCIDISMEYGHFGDEDK